MKKECWIALLIVAGAALSGLFVGGIRELLSRPPTLQTLHGAAALNQLKQDGQYESLQAAMSQARFSVSHSAQSPLGHPAWHAPNPVAGYDAYVTETGVSIAINDESRVSLTLHSLGYGSAMQLVGAGQVSGDKQTISIMREGGVREWYINGPDGLEQGFTISEPPGTRQNGVPLRLALQVSAGWRAVASEDGRVVTLHGKDGSAVEYSKLVVRDNVGRDIPARLTTLNDGVTSKIVIETEDGAAEYPLTIDPLFTLRQRLTASDGAAQDILGHAVALDGNTALVGAPYDDVSQTDQGSAYVFVRNGSTWTQQARLIANDGANLDLLGWAVALDGDTALVGAYNGPGVANADQGAAYVFVRQGTVWTQQARLNASDGVAAGRFGTALALDGDTALVGAPDYRVSSILAPGAAYVFVRQGTAWSEQKRLTTNDGADNDQFGAAVALENGTALVGAPADDVNFNGNQGSAYVFTRNGVLWGARQRLTASNGAANDHFGNAVALSNDTALIGAYLRFSDDLGLVYVFDRLATGWTEATSIGTAHRGAGAHFGVSVALDGKIAVIGASLNLFEPGVDQRSAYVFARRGRDFLEVHHFGPELGTAGDRFGYAVAVHRDTVLVGAYWADPSATDQGAAYVFVMHDSRHADQQKLSAHDGEGFDYLGKTVAIDGDTLVVGADGDEIGTNDNQGSIYVFTRTGTVWTFQQKITANDGASGDYFGCSVALSGDTLVAGAYADDIAGNESQGSAYVFVRTGSTWALQQKIMASGIDGLPNDRFGISVAMSGETVAVGASGVDASKGAVYVFTRNGTAWMEQGKLTANDGEGGDDLGLSVAISGNALVAGAPFDRIGMNDTQGSAYVFTRTGTVWAPRGKLTASDGEADDRFGCAVAVSETTAVVGSFFDTIGDNRQQGSVYVYARSGTSWVFAQKLMAKDGGAGDRFGVSVALSEGTMVIGASYDTIGMAAAQGSSYVFTYLGFWFEQQKLTASDGDSGDYFGRAVAVSNDTVAVGASGDDFDANSSQGSAYIFVSPGCPSLALDPARLPNGVLGASYLQKLTATGGSVATEYEYQLTSGALPPGLQLFGNSVLGTPTTAGTYRFTITATHGVSYCTGSREYTISISTTCPTVTISPAMVSTGTIGLAFSQGLMGTGGESPYTLTVNAGSALPPGLSLVNGVITGIPTQLGTFNFVMRVSDLNGCVGLQAFFITIIQVCTVNPVTLPTARVGAAYNQTLIATGGTAPYTFAVSSGSLPQGMGLSATGQLSGTPAEPGSFRFTISATANGCAGTRVYTLSVNCVSVIVKPTILPAPQLNVPYSETLTTEGGVTPYRYTISGGALPPGLSLSTTGVVSGTPSQAGTFGFLVTVQDAGVCAAVKDYTLTIDECSYTLTPANRSFPVGGGAGEVTVTARQDCAWTALSSSPWLTITSDASGTGNGGVAYTVSANSGAARQAIVSVAGQTHNVQQAGVGDQAPRIMRLAPNAVRRGADGLVLDVFGEGFTASQRVNWNGGEYETTFVSATHLQAVITAAALSNEGNVPVKVIDAANGSQSNGERVRIVGAVAHASAASYDTITLAPDSIITAFGVNLATSVRAVEALPLPTELAGTTVTVVDSQGTASQASLFFVSPGQINYLMPSGLANGIAIVTITNGDGVAVESLTEISSVAPGLFSANATGAGAASALILRVRENGEQVYEPVAVYDEQTQAFLLLPIDLSNAAEQVYLVLYGTGIRRRGALEEVTLKLGETELPVAYASAAPSWEGLDQVNVLLRSSLRGRGEQAVGLLVNGSASNGVKVHFQ